MLEHNEMKKVIRSTRDDGQKSWNFPKFAMLSHVFDGVCGKGVIMNYCTKPQEKEHQWTREVYSMGNKKEVGKQVYILGCIFHHHNTV
jgi:hypothetical protein